MATKIVVGETINRLTAIQRQGISSRGAVLWEFQCACGNRCVKEGRLVRSGGVKSCGCLVTERAKKLNYTHGFGKTKLYSVYSAMVGRCNNHKDKSFKNYGGRGIQVTKEWLNDFMAFREWALQNGYKEGLSIDRIDVEKDYSPDNCRWVTRDVQNNNKRNNILISYKGKEQSLKQWCQELNLNYSAIYTRIKRGNYSPIEALEKPMRNRKEEQ
ncbi:TPA: hypothetical protein ACLQU7_005228 [Bacillus tropicus]|uniref:hypothetical protein n=1 Tax=Bacillus tropicus TaxID=2026188 RepID=UPI00003CC559|nr:hypothetical protein [Bacillus tropicus]AIY72807.1 hypothetical protein NT98_5884 [Bacillus cereus]AJI02697.1 hypothetical protein AQ16_5880 [Bacillus cereus G9241]EAL11185.1 conserved hypothetical protein protein [Bacillus cereus G9241]QPS48223.1 hypothetical protein I6G54_01075 [Bacillus tropicus]